MLWLRLVHILAGVFWVGSAVFMAAIVLPAARAAGAEGGHFMERLMQQPRTRAALGGAMVLTVLSGIAMYGRLGGFQRAWVTSPQGVALGLGGVAAIAAAVIGAIRRGRSPGVVAGLLVLAVAAMVIARYL
ncbi:MAG: hypothetical protein AUH42_00455 [Gemmatimonadetes bacterium 13_1_40CM_70_11]|nr:MAG: hypothetical protein AUH42_00455 [Gemmatimonadetes bacterium 13_1_40CM_70_11]